MENIKLNIGGLFGALLGAGFCITMAILLQSEDGVATRRWGRLLVVGVIAGAFLGNFLWGSLFQRDEDSMSDISDTEKPPVQPKDDIHKP